MINWYLLIWGDFNQWQSFYGQMCGTYHEYENFDMGSTPKHQKILFST